MRKHVAAVQEVVKQAPAKVTWEPMMASMKQVADARVAAAASSSSSSSKAKRAAQDDPEFGADGEAGAEPPLKIQKIVGKQLQVAKEAPWGFVFPTLMLPEGYTALSRLSLSPQLPVRRHCLI